MLINTSRGILRTLIILSVFILAPSLASAATYYVSPTGNDGNSGTQSLPWRTIQKAANTLSASDTAILMNGTYTEPSINFNNSGTASNRITFKAQNKHQAILSSTSGCDPGFSIAASYITVEDIRFSVSPGNVACGSYISTNLAIRAWESGVGHVARGILIDYSPQRDLAWKSNQDFTIIENSEIHDEIEPFGSQSPIVRNNVVYSAEQRVAILGKGGVRNMQIYNNIVHVTEVDGSGIMIGGYSCDGCHFDTSTMLEAYNSVAYNNVVINESGGNAVGLTFMGAKDSAFFNNVVIGGHLSIQKGGTTSGLNRASTVNPAFKNNILSGNGSPATSGYYGWDGAWTGTLTVDHNNFSNYSSAVPSQTNAITGDPRFVNASTNWHLQSGSPAIDSATAVSFTGFSGQNIDVSRDKDGVGRLSPWDLGVYNVGGGTPPPSLPDVVVASVSYANGIFTATVKNQGKGATSGSSLDVGFSVDGAQQTYGSLTAPLPAGASVTIDNVTKCSGGYCGGAYTVPNGTHTIMATADGANRFAESNETNNQLSITVGGADTTPPSVPTGLTGVASASQVSLSWKTSTDKLGVTGYRVYRNGTQIAAPASNSYIDGSLVPGTYRYTVAAVDAASNVSARSGSMSATVASPLPDVIIVPGSFSYANGVFTATVKNQGTGATSGSSFDVGFQVDGVQQTYGSLTTPLAAGASVTIDNVTKCSGGGYCGGAYTIPTGTHTITAYVDSENRFAESNETNNQLSQPFTVGATPDTTAPTVPTGLTAVASASQVSLSWNASSDNVGVTGYRVYRNGTQIAAPASQSYINGNLIPGTYSYTVAAVDAGGNVSAQSGSVSATVLLPPRRLRLSLGSPIPFNAAAEGKT